MPFALTWIAKQSRHNTQLEFKDQGQGMVLVTLEATMDGKRDMGIAFWLDYTQSKDLAVWLLKRNAP